jgi:hypothetical protein
MNDSEALESASRRAARVAQAWAERPQPAEPYTWVGSAGSVTLRAVQAAVEGELVYVRVWTGLVDLEGPAHFKIVNPPLLVVDSAGNLTEDPLAALAQTIATSTRTARKVKR